VLIEEKPFKDIEGRLTVDHKAAGYLLESWGMRLAQRWKNDLVFVWKES
jgi:hypothetical protein